MIKDLYSIISNQRVSFKFNDELGVWEAISPLPYNEKGYELVEIYAIDEAGNESYFATFKMIFDTTKRNIKMIKDNYYGLIKRQYERSVVCD